MISWRDAGRKFGKGGVISIKRREREQRRVRKGGGQFGIGCCVGLSSATSL